jgi:hypothetical protein
MQVMPSLCNGLKFEVAAANRAQEIIGKYGHDRAGASRH